MTAARSSARAEARWIRGSARLAHGWNVPGLAFAAAALVAAEAAVRMFALDDVVPAPSASAAALAAECVSGELPRHLLATLSAFGQGIAAAAVAGVVVGTAIGSSAAFRSATTAVIEFLRPIPSVALIPLAIMFFGLGVEMRRFIVAYVALWPILVNTASGVRGTDRVLVDAARMLGAGGTARFVRVRIPAAAPSIAAGLRIGAAAGLLACVTAEFIAGSEGLGAYMARQQLAYELPALYGAVVLTGIVGLALNNGLVAVERRLLFWTPPMRAAAR